jgi:hypothetical protein
MAKKIRDTKKNKTFLGNTESGDESGDGGEGGSNGGGGGFIPSYNDLIAVDENEAEIAKNAKEALLSQRISLKSQGNKVTALDKLSQKRNQLYDPTMAAQLAAGGGSNLEQHPELANEGGAFDDIVFPESEAEAAASNDPQLRNRLAAKLGMGRDLNVLTQKMEYEKKEKLKIQSRPAPAPEEELRPSYRPSTPRPRPPGT